MQTGDKGVLITGPPTGTGTALARLLAAKGHALLLVTRREDRPDDVARDAWAANAGKPICLRA